MLHVRRIWRTVGLFWRPYAFHEITTVATILNCHAKNAFFRRSVAQKLVFGRSCTLDLDSIALSTLSVRWSRRFRGLDFWRLRNLSNFGSTVMPIFCRDWNWSCCCCCCSFNVTSSGADVVTSSAAGGGSRSKSLGRESTTTLKTWLLEHIKNPYPSKGEKIMLAVMTRMTLTQVSTWFANARRRLKKVCPKHRHASNDILND